jgi:imidazolonepropionase-like amidohydrolase
MGGQLASGSLAHLLPMLADLGLKPVLILDEATAARDAAVLAKAKLPVVVHVALSADPITRRYVNPARALHEAKVPFALNASGPTNATFEGMRHRLALLVRAGLPRDVALAAVTVSPAKLLGLEKRVGSIQPGRDADLVLYDGDPLDPLARVVRVILGGKTVHERPEAGR